MVPSRNRQCGRYNREYCQEICSREITTFSFYREFRERFAWLPERDASSNGDTESNVPLSPPTPVSALSAGEVTHIRTFRIYEAIKSDDYTLTYDSY